MLRITQAIELTLRKKESKLSLDFIKALTLALLIHLVLFLLFRIISLPNVDRVPLLTPIAVETDLKTDAINVLPGAAPDPFLIDTPAISFDRPLAFKKEVFSIEKTKIDEPAFFVSEKLNDLPITKILEEEESLD